jgi:uncharacterized LabA/DUF88 family protein
MPVHSGFLFYGKGEAAKMSRIKFFIDGFNVYHALEREASYHKYKWLDYSKLASLFVRRQDQIVDVLYFTALANWDVQKVNRHKIFISALKFKGVKVILGQFQRVEKRCRNCHQHYYTFEEKKTDVNIAVELFKSAVRDEFDTAIIISGDSDLVPAVEAVKTLFPAKKVGVVIPINWRAVLLKQVCDFHMKMKEKHLKASLLPDEIDLGGGIKLFRPPTWR